MSCIQLFTHPPYQVLVIDIAGGVKDAVRWNFRFRQLEKEEEK
jgi:hypothetical protein